MEIQAFEKTWVLASQSAEQLIFVPRKTVTLWTQKKGYKRSDNFLKSWRLRIDRPKPNEKRERWTQERAAEFFGVTQSFIAKVETGKKPMTKKMQEVVFGATKGEMAQTKKDLEETASRIRARR